MERIIIMIIIISVMFMNAGWFLHLYLLDEKAISIMLCFNSTALGLILIKQLDKM